MGSPGGLRCGSSFYANGAALSHVVTFVTKSSCRGSRPPRACVWLLAAIRTQARGAHGPADRPARFSDPDGGSARPVSANRRHTGLLEQPQYPDLRRTRRDMGGPAHDRLFHCGSTPSSFAKSIKVCRSRTMNARVCSGVPVPLVARPSFRNRSWTSLPFQNSAIAPFMRSMMAGGGFARPPTPDQPPTPDPGSLSDTPGTSAYVGLRRAPR